jgi:hypothetical protein
MQQSYIVYKPILQNFVMLSLLWVDVILPQYKPLKYAIIHLSRLAYYNTLCYGSPNLPLITVISSLVMHYMP